MQKKNTFKCSTPVQQHCSSGDKGDWEEGTKEGKKNPMFQVYFILTSEQEEEVTKPFQVLQQKRNGNKHLILGYILQKIWHTNTKKAEVKGSKEVWT